MKCSNCNKYVTSPYMGCTWCMLPTEVREDLDEIENISEQVRNLAKKTRKWGHAEIIIKFLAEYRIDTYDKGIKQLYAEMGQQL